MAHFAIVSPDDAGHMLSMGPLGKELVRRGHRVTILGRSNAAPLAQRLELPLYELHDDDVPYPWSYPLWLVFQLFGAGANVNMRAWCCWRAELALKHVPPAIKELGIEGLLVDHTVTGGGSAAEHAGIPFVTVSTALLWNEEPWAPPAYTSWPYAEGRRAVLRNRLGHAAWHWFIRPTLNVVNRYRAQWNLPTFSHIDDSYSPLAHISQLYPGLDFPRRQLRDTFHYVGSLAATRNVTTDYPFPWERLDGRPLIFASLGTVPDRSNPPVFRKILAACAGLDAQLVLALGKWGDEAEEESLLEQLGAIPANAIVVDFAPQLALFDRTAVLITHAGVNTVLEAISRGVPMVTLARSADQPGMAARVAHAGAGLRGSFRRSSAREIRGLVERVLAEDTFRSRLKQLQQDLLDAGGLDRAADIAEEALLTRRPVKRGGIAPPDYAPHAEPRIASPASA